MKVLAFDSTAKTASVCICDGEKLVGIYSVTAGLNHSQTLLPMVESLLKTSKMTMSDIDMFAVSEGPGSFTGVRIGVSLVKGLAFNTGKPCVGVSTLEALAYNLKGFCGYISPVMDARRDQVYNALFLSDGVTINRLTEDRAMSIDELDTELTKLTEGTKKLYFCGDGYECTKKKIKTTSEDTPIVLREQNAYSVAQVALLKYNSKENEDYSDIALKPKYLRVPQAERERLERMSQEENK